MDVQSDQKTPHMEYRKMEQLVLKMQNKKTGVEVKSQKSRFSTIPNVITGEDVIAWLHAQHGTDDTEEAQHLANLLCQHGYIFPVLDTKVVTVKADTTPYRFQDPRFWPFSSTATDNEAYAIYLKRRSLRNKQKHGLEEHEQLAFDHIQKLLYDKEKMIREKAEEQLKEIKRMELNEKAIYDSQERAFWRILRPAPGQVKRCEEGLKHYFQPSQVRERFARKDFLLKKLQILKRSYSLHWVKTSQAVEMCHLRAENYRYSDPFLTPVHPSNPWIAEDSSLWDLCNDQTAPATAQSVRRWEVSFWDLLADRKGRAEFKAFLDKEYSQENLRFWNDCENIKFCPASCLRERIDQIFGEYVCKGSPYEVNVDSKTRQQVESKVQEGRAGRPSRFTFLQAQEQIFRLMMKDSYVRFLRSQQFQQLQTNALQPEGKKGFFSLGFLKKQTLSPKAKQRGTGSQSEEDPAPDQLSITDQRHSHSTSSLTDLEGKHRAVLLRYDKNVPCSLRKSETSPSLSRRQDRASFTKGTGAHRKEQQQLDSPKHRSMNLENTAPAGLNLGQSASDAAT